LIWMKHKKIYADGHYVPQRMCIACRKALPQSNLIRVTKDKDGVAVVSQKAQGRSVYVCKSMECILKAQKIRGFERGLKGEVLPSVYEECIKLGE
jgi:predicted RNA-binding protein YlxR (DUF448 family)